MMAWSTNAPFRGRIQKRKTNHLQIIKSSLQRTAGPYKSARKRLMHCTNCELNDSAQVHRTLVPVEEPFTGSKPDIGL
ncbi:hypothetical protein SAMN05444171_1578 [Bradyrhizobium lablabi]|jgi:hypothetical protein|uniref:Uncharacterized protein n=2 Tax=Bradyrhizobium TaxID=374 RepID=A0ABY0Q4D4_9BRAD|nr:hypothetical protein SAMN05444163_5581 [Bradyrhizobium ottawaense]SEC50693.1 hypothetical protein SAMN05444171_1578 [Bradyrhizobium lablabi]SHK70521.1 hypothetical protein SAMN05444321_0408 [Bradyrhizobium lablabi]